jgi:hypothetical protein
MSVYRLTPEERETVITINDDGKTAMIFTWQRRMQKRLLANPEAKLLADEIHNHPDDRCMKFEVPKDLVTVRNRRVLSSERRQQLAGRMRQLKATA